MTTTNGTPHMGWRWSKAFPQLDKIDDPAWARACGAAFEVTVAAGTVLFREGDRPPHYLMCLDGMVRVSKTARSGREVLLYRVGPGESCILLTAVLLNNSPLPATALVESTTRAIAIPANEFRHAMDGSTAFRQFVLSDYSSAVCRMVGLIEEVVFGRVDTRLARVLLDRMPRGGAVTLSHRDLALELGTAREVVSRQLKTLAASGCVALGRRQIMINDIAALQRLADAAL